MTKSSIRLTFLSAVATLLVASGSLMHVSRVNAMAYIAAHDMDGHMSMTKRRPVQPGDKERADVIVVAARRFALQYLDYRKAEADGYKIFMPQLPQRVYHFTQNAAGAAAQFKFNPDRPTSLLYEKTKGSEPGYKLIGVMYTDRFTATEDELDQRVPLSIAQWHVHTNLCLPPRGQHVDWLDPEVQFGLAGSIRTEAACEKAGGSFMPHLFGWMVHVYPFETDAEKVWSAGMEDDRGMQHESMPGMKM